MRVFVQGDPKPVELSSKEFRASGGQGAIYVKGDTAYKIFGAFLESPPGSGKMAFQGRPDWALPLGRIQELATVRVPEAVNPKAPLIDSAGTLIGHTMRAISAKYVLTATMPRVFRDREGLKPDASLRIVRTIQGAIKAAHSQRFKLVDIQPNNFLLTEDFKDIYIIDVDSWATPHYPAIALIDSARDWVTCPTNPPPISDLTDWWSFALLAFEILVGIHPFKGRHPSFAKVAIRERMESRKSVLNPEVHVDPDSIMPLSVIPPVYRGWFEALFERGERLPPPEGLVNVVSLAATPTQAAALSSVLNTRVLRTFLGDWVEMLPGGIDVGTLGLSRQGRRIADHEPRSHYAVTPRGQKPIRCRLGVFDPATGMRRLELTDLESGAEITSPYQAHDITSQAGRVLIRVGDQLLALSWLESPAGVVKASAAPVAQVSAHTTRLYPGVALQELLGATYATLLPAAGGAYERRLRELEGARMLDAWLTGSVLQVATDINGLQSILTFRFGRGLTSYDLTVEDITATGFTGFNLAILDTGVCVENRGGDLTLYSAQPGAGERKEIKGAVPAGMQLEADGSRLLGAIGGQVLHLSLS